MTTVVVDNVSRVFFKSGRAIPAVSTVTFEVASGQRLVLLGPSGCGKSTILNMIAGILPSSTGQILFDEQPVRGISDTQRIVGYMTQADTILPWRSALGNVMLPLEIQGVPRSEREVRAHSYLDLVGLTGFEHHYPKELSGGMQKRVALARTLVYEPGVLLMDEPFGALDAQTRLVLQNELLRLLREAERRTTVVFVTHDLSEALTVGDVIIVFSRRPARVKLVHRVNLQDGFTAFNVRSQPSFAEQHDLLWQALEGEVVMRG